MSHPLSGDSEEQYLARKRGYEHTRSLVHRLAYEIRAHARLEERPLGLIAVYPILVGAERKELWVLPDVLKRQGRAVEQRQRQLLRDHETLIRKALTLLLTTDATQVTIRSEEEMWATRKRVAPDIRCTRPPLRQVDGQAIARMG